MGGGSPHETGARWNGHRHTPTGTVTFLFTDIEGSTRLWQQNPEAMKAALVHHHALLQHSIRVARRLGLSGCG